MAEVTAFRNNALPYPVYGVPWAIVFPLLDADGDPITPSAPDSERSLNGDTFADCTNEAVEIATSTGVCYLLLTAAEMTADIVAVRIQSTGAKTTVMTLYPRKLVSLRTGTSQGGAAGSITLDASAGAVDDIWNGCLVVAVIDTLTEARIITDYTGSSQVAAVTPNWNVTPDSDDTFTVYLPEGRQLAQSNLGAIASAALSTTTAQLGVNAVQAGATAWGSGAITAASIAADAITAAKIADGAIDAATLAADTITAAKIADGAIDAATFAAGAINAAAIATGAIDADALASDAVDEIWAKAMSDLAAVPGATASVLSGLNFLFELARNRITQTATTTLVFKDDATTTLATGTVSDNGTTLDRGELA